MKNSLLFFRCHENVVIDVVAKNMYVLEYALDDILTIYHTLKI